MENRKFVPGDLFLEETLYEYLQPGEENDYLQFKAVKSGSVVEMSLDHVETMLMSTNKVTEHRTVNQESIKRIWNKIPKHHLVSCKVVTNELDTQLLSLAKTQQAREIVTRFFTDEKYDILDAFFDRSVDEIDECDFLFKKVTRGQKKELNVKSDDIVWLIYDKTKYVVV